MSGICVVEGSCKCQGQLNEGQAQVVFAAGGLSMQSASHWIYVLDFTEGWDPVRRDCY